MGVSTVERLHDTPASDKCFLTSGSGSKSKLGSLQALESTALP